MPSNPFYNIPLNDFEWYFNLVGSPLKYHYERGQLIQQANRMPSNPVTCQNKKSQTFSISPKKTWLIVFLKPIQYSFE